MTLDEVRKRYLEYFQKAPRSHVAIPSASLVPENDPTTLFTGSGMQPLLPYLLGERHPKGVRLANSQKCFRAEDIEEVGDNRHTTFFEMLGNWSLGDYWKEEQLPWCFEFLTKEIGLDPNKLYVTVFAGDVQNDIPPDDVSASTWKGLFADAGIETKDAVMGSEEDGSRRGMKEGERIFYYNATKNWWSRSGIPEKMPPGEPGGPDSEVFYDFETPHDNRFGEQCHPNCDCGRFMEIGNSVFMEYIKKADGTFEPLPQRNVDFGAGLERITAAKNNTQDVFVVNVFSNIIQHLEVASGKRYENEKLKQSFRVIADHMRAAIFMIAD
ncbi:MAG TPA: alanine--tRNA ligase-related protein, partial [Candidatus Paceibacterota bacterium]